MNIVDLFFLAYKALATRKVRATLLVLSVVVGVASIVALTSQTEGVARGITSALQKLGPDTVILMVMGRRLTDADIALVSSLDSVREVIPITVDAGTLNTGSMTLSVTVYGVSSEDLRELLGEIKLIDGSLYTDSPIPMAIVGYQVAFPNATSQPAVLPGQYVVVNVRAGSSRYAGSQVSTPIPVVVAGILGEYGASAPISPDSSIFIPLQAAQQVFNKKWYDLLVIKAVSVDSVYEVVEDLRNIYGSSANVISLIQVSQSIQTVLSQTTLLLGSIAAISLITAAIGILNMMIVTVTERTREIGIMKALGFKNKHILVQVLMEGSLIGLLGGLIGVVAGIGASYLIHYIATIGITRLQGGSTVPRGAMPVTPMASFSYEPYINPVVVLTALVLALAVSGLSSLYPAWRAAKMDPVKALRYE